MSSQKPDFESVGELKIPFDTFYKWALQFINSTGTFVAWGHVKEDADGLVVKYRQSSGAMPTPPEAPELLPAPPPAPQPLPPA